MKQILLAFFLVISTSIFAQVNYNANTQVVPYAGAFRQGINLDYYPPYSDIDLANLSAGNPALGISGIGANTSRPALFESFMEAWGYESRLSTFQHMGNLGMNDMTCIVGYPSEAHRDHTIYCSDGVTQSAMFTNLYTDIWDGGLNGTPYNDDNYLAAYLYKTVSLYKGQVKFWEIWNEPGFDLSWNTGWREPGDLNGNWWDQDPDPCDNILHAPIEHFVRTLRVSYEVIKTVDPDAYVCLAGVGFESFLDAVLRNTDNPVDGTPTAEYPLGGGAYFDVMGFHTYPDIDGSLGHYDSNINDWVRYRHSDAAVDGIENRKNTYAARLAQYGYNGVTYPKKEWIVTEANTPRVAFNAITMASEESQINYILKAVVRAMQLDIRQFHPYQLADRNTVADADDEYDLMGMYLNFTGTTPYDGVQKTTEGIAYKSSSLALKGTIYDPAKTAEMNLPDSIRGGAFEDPINNRYVYVLWAKTDTDMSEAASATYSFPASFGYATLAKREWDYSETNTVVDIAPTDIQLSGRPLYFLDGDEVVLGDMSLTCPPSVEALIPTGESAVVVSWVDPIATTTCPASTETSIQLSSAKASGENFTVGTYIVIYEATDNCTHQKVCSFTVTVTPEEQGQITLTCPDDIIVAVPEGLDRTVVSWDDAVASTTCIDPSVTIAQPGGQPSGAEFVVGGHTIGYTASDLCGNYEECTFLITVQAAAGSCPSSILAFTKLGEENGHGYFLSQNKLNWQEANTLSQNSGGYLASINSQEENDYLHNQIEDMVFIGLNDNQTEESLVWGNGDAVSYTNYNTVCDWCGINTDYNDYVEMTPWDGTWIFEGQWAARKFVLEMNCNAESEIQLTCGSDISISTSTSSAMVTWEDPQATTTCMTNSVVTIAELAGEPSGSDFSIGTHLISYQATDECGNIASCSFSINVSPQSSDCSNMPGYTLLGTQGDHGYYMSEEKTDWVSAKVLSENVDGYLATINDAEENEVLKNMLGFEMAFIGYNDAATEGAAAWADGGTSTIDLSFNNTDDNDYAVMNFWAGTWQLVNFQVAKKYIVEKTCVSTPPTGCQPVGGFSLLGEFEGNGYYLSNQPHQWTTSAGIAENNGGYLASISTQVENDFIQDKIGNEMPFIGFNDAATEGTAAWQHGESVTLDLSINNTEDNDYAVMTFWNGEWQMISGGVYRRFVMEMACATGTTGFASEELTLAVNQNKVVASLTWQDISKEAVSHFIVERSADDAKYLPIGQIENTASRESSYEFLDTEPLVGDNYYRISAVTLAGKKRISNTGKANFAERLHVSIYPNPAGESVMIDLLPFKGKAVDVVISDQFGKVIKQINIDEVSPAPLRINLSDIQNGMYQISVQPKVGQSVTKKLVILRNY